MAYLKVISRLTHYPDLFGYSESIGCMRKTFLTVVCACAGMSLVSCQKHLPGFIKGQSSHEFFEPQPFGMAYIKEGSYVIGDDETAGERQTSFKQVSVESFWMDETEITNNEYRQFVFWVRDSIARRILSGTFPEFIGSDGDEDDASGGRRLNWDDPIEWRNPKFREALADLYIPEDERFFQRAPVDSRKLIYDYYRIDYRQAAGVSNKYDYETQTYRGTIVDETGKKVPVKDRSSFIIHESVPIYPDTLCWVRDFTYSYNEPLTENYFSHRAYDDYPVVGVTWTQARAFCNWRTKIYNDAQMRSGVIGLMDYRLPTEAEWEYAARGGHEHTLYPWGSYYARTEGGCLRANFKPERGNYVSDTWSGCTTVKVGSYEPNDYGLYDMAGNVAEWTNTAYYESGYDVMGDMNPILEYNALPDNPPDMKRKVIRGGSWKDVAYFLRNGTRSYEYQDTAKSYIGFRCVKSAFNRSESEVINYR